jgi:hypothetical protein
MSRFVTIADVDTWRRKSTAQEHQGSLELAIDAAVSWVEREGGRRSIEKKTVTVTLDGSRADGHTRSDLWLPPDVRPVWHTTTPNVVAVSEDGSSLTVAAGYSASADVIVHGANEDVPVMLYRRGGWYPGRRNVAVTLVVGYDVTPPTPEGVFPSVLPLPSSIRQLIIEAAWLTFNSEAWLGHQNVSRAGAAVTISNELSPMASETLANLRGTP